jgi:hypothetical protein
VAESPAVNESTGTSPAGLILLEWNGSSWHTVARNPHVHDVTDITPDGHDGFWLSVLRHDITDYRNGKFTRQNAPGRDGYVTAIVPTTGAGSFWAIGGFSGGNDILRYLAPSTRASGAEASPAAPSGYDRALVTTGRPGNGRTR